MSQEEAAVATEEVVDREITANDLAETANRLQQESESEADSSTQESETVTETEAPASWEDQPLPAGHKYAGKYKTNRDFLNAYESSGTEARRLKEELDYQTQIARGVEILKRNQAQAQPAQPTAATTQTAQSGYLGYASQDAFSHAMQADPNAAMSRVVEFAMGNNPKLIEEKVTALLQERMAPIEQERKEQFNRQVQEELTRSFEDVKREYPELDKQDSPLREAVTNFIASEEGSWIPAFYDIALQQGVRMPNPSRIAVMLADYPIMKQKLQAFEAKHGEKQKQADSARPGQSVAGKPKSDGTPAGNVDLAVSNYIEQHGEAPTKEQIAAMKRAFANMDFNT